MPATPPDGFTWPNGAKLAFSLVVNVEEGAEKSILDGDKGPERVEELGAVPAKAHIRVHGNESNYQSGITRGAPRVLKLLDKHQIPATWTAASLALERAPWLAKALMARSNPRIIPRNHRMEQMIEAAVAGDMAVCAGPPDTLVPGSGTVLIGGMPAIRMGDASAHGGTIVGGEPTVLIGG
jgi:peptidoglycan/xylan/chitin deacetylase (PgdA/CDA1 family)